MGLEVLDQVPDLDAIVIPVGGGGLIAGSSREVLFNYVHYNRCAANLGGINPDLEPTFKTSQYYCD